MSKFIIAAFALLLCGAGSPLSYADQRLLVVGDSLSAAYGFALNAGWVALLGDDLEQRGARLEVINASISGDTSQGGLSAAYPHYCKPMSLRWSSSSWGPMMACKDSPCNQ